MRVLIAEDEIVIAEALRDGLRRQGIVADIVHDGGEALHRLTVNHYDTLVLDRDLPVVHGDEVCRAVVADHPQVRVLMLTAAGTSTDKVTGLELGADDYLTKPFDFLELVARLRAIARRNIEKRPDTLRAGDLEMNTFRRTVTRAGAPVTLSRKEFAVLEQLLLADGGVLSAEELLERAWDENADPFTNSVRVTMSTLRRRLGNPALIRTVPGVGYRVEAE